MAARFGAKIVPFGVVGEDDIVELLLDYDDFVKIPYLKAQIEELTNEVVQLRYIFRNALVASKSTLFLWFFRLLMLGKNFSCCLVLS